MATGVLFRRARGCYSLALMLLFLVSISDRAWCAPDPMGAASSLIGGPLKAAGSVVGGSGLIAAASLGLAADVVSLVDRNPLTRRVLHGAVSRTLHGVALGISWTTSGLMQALRLVDIERLPEASATYLTAAPGVGRLDTLLGGMAALRLGVGDVVTALPLGILRLAGVKERSEGLLQRRVDAEIRALGPAPLEN